MPLVLFLVIGEKKHFVFLDRSTERGSELIEIEFFGGGGEKAACVQIRIAEKLEEASVELIGTILVVTKTVGPPRVPNSAE